MIPFAGSRGSAALPLLVLLSVVGLTACTPPTGAADATYQYVDSLRGANDLVHGSLVVPPTANLKDFASTVAAQAYAGLAKVEYSDAALSQLVARTGGDSTELLAQVCAIPGVDGDRATALVVKVGTLPDPMPTFDGIDDFPALADAWEVLRCFDRQPLATAAYRQAVRDAVAPYPLAALRAVDLGLLDAGEVTNFDSVAPDLAQRLSQDGCTEDVMEEASALQGLQMTLSADLHACALYSGSPVSRASTLDTLRMADAPAAQVADLLRRSPEQIREWTTLDETLLPEWPKPIGLGTLEATRDAVELLTLADIPRPSWISSGVQSALGALSSEKLEPTDSQAADLLYLCTVTLDNCPPQLRDQVTNAIRKEGVQDVPNADARVARMVEALVIAGTEMPITCTSGLARIWVEDAPLTLAALAATQEPCITLTTRSEGDFARLALSAMNDGELEQAVAYSRMRKYLVPVVSDVQQRSRMLDALAQFDKQLRAVGKNGQLERARPVNLELARAALRDAIE